VRGSAEIEQIDENVYLITGEYVSLVAEFTDHLLVFEAGATEARGQQVLDAVRGLIPDKPVRYIANSHPHSDHTGGFVPFIRAGATVVTHENNIDFLRTAFAAPRTLLGEAPLQPRFQGVGELGVFEDASLRVELIQVPNTHFEDMLVAYLPEQKILFQADFDMLVPGRPPNVFVVTLAEFVDRTGLDFERYLSVHPAPVPQTKADLMRAIGK
jgi:flavorubredoxin